MQSIYIFWAKKMLYCYTLYWKQRPGSCTAYVMWHVKITCAGAAKHNVSKSKSRLRSSPNQLICIYMRSPLCWVVISLGLAPKHKYCQPGQFPPLHIQPQQNQHGSSAQQSGQQKPCVPGCVRGKTELKMIFKSSSIFLVKQPVLLPKLVRDSLISL